MYFLVANVSPWNPGRQGHRTPFNQGLVPPLLFDIFTLKLALITF